MTICHPSWYERFLCPQRTTTCQNNFVRCPTRDILVFFISTNYPCLWHISQQNVTSVHNRNIRRHCICEDIVLTHLRHLWLIIYHKCQPTRLFCNRLQNNAWLTVSAWQRPCSRFSTTRNLSVWQRRLSFFYVCTVFWRVYLCIHYVPVTG